MNKIKKFLQNEENRILVWAVILAIIALTTFSCERAGAETIRKDNLWQITAYCSCKSCCNKSDGITASGKLARKGYCALNWLPFGTKLTIDGLGEYTVMDRGAKSLFGSQKNHIKHLDIWFPTHSDALNFGKQYRNVVIKK